MDDKCGEEEEEKWGRGVGVVAQGDMRINGGVGGGGVGGGGVGGGGVGGGGSRNGKELGGELGRR